MSSSHHHHDPLIVASGRWLRSEQSCGRDFHAPEIGLHFWEAVGPAAACWASLNPELVSVVEHLNETSAFLSIHFAMVGKSKESSSPRILVCSKHRRVQMAVRDEILERRLLTRHPGIGMDACPNPPVPLAFGVPEPAPAAPQATHHPHAWATKARQQIGRKLYILNPDGSLLIATGGVTFFAGTKSYQLSSIHDNNESRPLDVESTEIVFDLESDDFDFGDNNEFQDPFHDNGTGAPGTHEGGNIDVTDGPSVFHMPTSVTQSFTTLFGKDRVIPRDAVNVGKIVGHVSSLDYVLVELETYGDRDSNRVQFGAAGSRRTALINRVGSITSKEHNSAIAIVTSTGTIDGDPSMTPHIIKPEGQDKCQNLYAIKVAGNRLRPGDSGSAVIDTTAREILGHIVAGHVGTDIAYMLPMEDIIHDIGERQILENFSLEPREGPPQRTRHALKQEVKDLVRNPWTYISSSTNLELVERVEFSSRQFYLDETGQEMPKRRRLKSWVSGAKQSLKKAWAPDSQKPIAEPPLQAPSEDYFSLLPAELRDLIIRELPPRSAWSLRQVSRIWRASVRMNAFAISKLFLHRHPLPPLVQRIINTGAPTLEDIEWVRHGYDVASRLAISMSKWMCTELYGFTSKEQKREFKTKMRWKLQQRLIPSLFCVFYFLDKYPFNLVRHLRQTTPSDGALARPSATPSPYAFESSMISQRDIFSDDMLVRMNQTLQLVVHFVDFIWRPPTYSVRGSLTARHQALLPPSINSAVLCIGGLTALVRFAEMSNLEERRQAAGQFFASVDTGRDAGPNADLIRRLPRQDLSLLLSNLHAKPGDIWRKLCEDGLIKRGVYGRRNNIPGYAQVLTELIQPAEPETDADRLYKPHGLWHALADRDFGGGNEE